jgi:hypothetical protein
MSDLHELLAEEARRQTPERVPPFEGLQQRARQRIRMRRAAAVTGTLAGLAAVAAATALIAGSYQGNTPTGKPTNQPTSQSQVMLLPTDHWRPGDPGMQALTSGKLIIAKQGDAACAWVGSQASAVLWPEGYGVRLQPAELLDADGKVIARAGQTIAAAGGGSEAAAAGPCNNAGQWTFSIQSDVRAGTSLTALPACSLGEFRLRQISVPGGAGGTVFLTLAVDQTRAAGCAISRLSVAYLDGAGRPIGTDSSGSHSFLDERVARLVDSVPVIHGTTLYLRVATPEPADFGLQGCGARKANRLLVTVNRTHLWLPTTTTVCSTTTGRPSISVEPAPTSQRNRVSILAKPL